MLVKRLFTAAACTVAASLVFGRTTVERSSDRAREVVTGVGNKVEYHANKVSRKTRSFWQRIFGGGGEETSSKHKTKPARTPDPVAPATRLPSYSPKYVGDSN